MAFVPLAGAPARRRPTIAAALVILAGLAGWDVLVRWKEDLAVTRPPDDPRSPLLTGGRDAVSAVSVRLDRTRGAIAAPDSMGRPNFARVIVFFRNDDLVGWREIVIVHR